MPILSEEDMRYIREKLSLKQQQMKMPTSNMTPLTMSQISMSPLTKIGSSYTQSALAHQMQPKPGQSSNQNLSKQQLQYIVDNLYAYEIKKAVTAEKVSAVNRSKEGIALPDVHRANADTVNKFARNMQMNQSASSTKSKAQKFLTT